MAKIQLKSDNINPFGGLFSILYIFNRSGLRSVIDRPLGRRGGNDRGGDRDRRGGFDRRGGDDRRGFDRRGGDDRSGGFDRRGGDGRTRIRLDRLGQMLISYDNVEFESMIL